MTYTLTKEDGSELDEWMIFDDETLLLQGLVPLPEVDSEVLTLSGTDGDTVTLEESFTIYYLSKPYLNLELDDISIRTLEFMSYTVSRETFEQPNNLPLEYNIYNYPDWLSLDNRTLTLSGTPQSTD